MTHVLAIFGSPRRGGNTDRLLEAFLRGAEEGGARSERVHAAEEAIHPCDGCQRCEIEGRCVIEDGMQRVYGLIDEADLIALASPVYFYGVTAQAKALIDRTQALWIRKHRLGIRSQKTRAGFLIAAGGSKGKRLFECAEMTMRYFCDAVDARYLGSLTFRALDRSADLERHPEYLEEARRTGRRTVSQLGSGSAVDQAPEDDEAP